MLYPWIDWQRAGLETWLAAADRVSAGPPADPLAAGRELLARTLAATELRERPIEDAVRRDSRFALEAREVAATPFVRLVHLRRPGGPRRRFVMVAAHSGYAAAVASPLIAELLALGEVVVTDWIDARLVPASAGTFTLDHQMATVMAAAATLAAPAHLVALSQAGPAALAAAALLAAGHPRLAPASLTFLGCVLDPRVAPTPLQRAVAHAPPDLLETTLTTRVGAPHPGAGRRVYPALLQLVGYGMASPGLYLEIQQGLLREIAAGEAGGYARQHGDLHSLLDVPAELFLETLDWVRAGEFDGAALRLGTTAHDLTALRSIPMQTVEAGSDELVGPGQTHAGGHVSGRAVAPTLIGARHHDLFTGPGFAARVAPLLHRFVHNLAPDGQ